ncbi:MAG: hypothetical protein WAO58_06990 [Fimbriimonadaceae bacterium]
MSETTAEKQPLINRRMAIRFIIGLFAIAALILGFQWYQAKGRDIGDLGTIDTKGWIAALELQPGGGAQAVAIKPDGAIVRNPDYVGGKVDRDLAWKPNGYQIFFSSDRDGKAFNIFRWNLALEQVEPRTKGTLSWSAPSFSGDTSAEGLKLVMCVSAGNVWERNMSDLSGQRLIPYTKDKGQEVDRQSQESDTSQGVQAAAIKRAEWGKDKAWIIAVRRTDTGEALVVQPMTVEDEKRIPFTVTAGDRVDFDVDPTTGILAINVQGFQWTNPNAVPEEFIKDGRATKPYLHAISLLDLNGSKPAMPVAVSKDPKRAFGAPSISPDGANMTFTTGAYIDGSYTPTNLFMLPTTQLSGEVGRVNDKLVYYLAPVSLGPESIYRVLSGEIYEPAWSPDGQTLVYVKREGNERSIYTADKTGTGEKRITAAGKNYASPLFSPQK